MKTQDTVAYCDACKGKVPFHLRPINHVMQCILSVCSLGLWLPIWLCLVLYRTKVCDKCGNPIEDAQ